MKIKNLMYVLMGTMVVATSCSEVEFENGENGSGITKPVNPSALVNVYSDESASEESLLVGDVLLKDTRTLMLNAPIACEKVYMKYNTVSGKERMKEFPLNTETRAVNEQAGDFDYITNRRASVYLTLPEDAVRPTDETDGGYLFYHNTGVAMFEDGWPTQPESWYDEDFNDAVVEYDLKVTECQSEEQMAIQGSKEELLLTLDVRAVGGRYPTKFGVVLDGLDSKYVDRITATICLKGGQGIMEPLGKVESSTEGRVTVEKRDWNWKQDRPEDRLRYAKVTVDKTAEDGTIVLLDGLYSLINDDTKNQFFQVTPLFIRTGLPMLRTEVRLIGKEGLTGAAREEQLNAFRELILDTKRQNFFIINHDGRETHMRGYKPTASYKATYDEKVAADNNLSDSYSNKDGYTWGVKMPVGARHAVEHLPFKEAYPEFIEWVGTKGAANKNWYENFDPEKTIRYW